MTMLADEARTKADAARVTREALELVAIEQRQAGNKDLALALWEVALGGDDVLLRIRGLIR